MGSPPNLETACYSGRSVAFHIGGSDISDAFEAWVHEADMKQIQTFQFNTIGRRVLEGVVADAAIGYGGALLWNFYKTKVDVPPAECGPTLSSTLSTVTNPMIETAVSCSKSKDKQDNDVPTSKIADHDAPCQECSIAPTASETTTKRIHINTTSQALTRLRQKKKQRS
jgi:hypothetical protein